MSSYITYQRLSFPSSEHHLILLSWCLFRHSALQGVWHILSSVLNITSFWGTNKYKRSQILKYRRNFTILFVFVSVCGELSQLLHCSSKQDWGIMCACRSLLYDVYKGPAIVSHMKYSFLLSSMASCRAGSPRRAASAVSANSVPLASLVWYVPLCLYMYRRMMARRRSRTRTTTAMTRKDMGDVSGLLSVGIMLRSVELAITDTWRNIWRWDWGGQLWESVLRDDEMSIFLQQFCNKFSHSLQAVLLSFL